MKKHPAEEGVAVAVPAAGAVASASTPSIGLEALAARATAWARAPKVAYASRLRVPRTCAPRRTFQRSGRPARRRTSSSSRTSSADPGSDGSGSDGPGDAGHHEVALGGRS